MGAENEILINNIRIGMLTPPRDKINRLEHEARLAADFFQKVPVSKLIVANYSPLFLDEIVLADGTVYLDESSDIGGWHNGDMRNGIAKNLISDGINAANFGLSSSSKGKPIYQPKFFNQYVAHIARGKYSNGIVDHGYSGGAGMVTLSDTVGNEFSHEMGHNFGLGHYPGGGQWATQNLDSGWGWDDFQQRFIANFLWNETGDADSQGYLTPPFAGIYRFNRDAMGGGGASSPISEYTLYTGYSQKRIQKNFETTGRISETMESGYAVWDNDSTSMVERQDNSRLKPKIFGTAVTTLVGYYDPENKLSSYIYPALHGSYGHVYDFGEVKTGQCWVSVTFADGQVRNIGVEGKRLAPDLMNRFSINVETSLDPVQAQVSCPTTGGYETWLKQYLDTSDLKSWEKEKREGIVGDIYVSGPSGITGKDYFKLLKPKYWYFPTHSRSNGDWEYLGNDSGFEAKYLDQLDGPFDAYGVEILDTRALQQPSEQPRPTIIVGEEFGYDQVFEQMIKDTPTFSEYSNIVSANIFEFNKLISKLYSVELVKQWGDSGEWGTVGDIYTKHNLSTGQHEYFMLKTDSYRTPPVAEQGETKNWLYLGSAETYINYAVNPLKLTLEPRLTVDQRLLDYYSQEKLISWAEHNMTYFRDSEGPLFVFDNPFSKQREYFLQNTPDSYENFPMNSESNASWNYVGNQSDIQKIVDTAINNPVAFTELVSSWYQHDVKRWEASNQGTVNDIYLISSGGIQAYYRLQTSSYSYFPTPLGNSNGSWEFLGHTN